jgi:hypothetical protein
MKLLLENWREYLKEGSEGSSPLDLEIKPEQKILALSEPWKGFPSDIQQEKGFKPNGVWYGCGDSWLKWMSHEMPEWLDQVNYVYELEINDEFMKVITNAEQFKSFEHEFWARAPYQKKTEHGGPHGGIYQMINWPLLADIDWDGIEICPYLWEFRLSNSEGWYYPWDVASGCIWDSEALVGEPKLLWQREAHEFGEEEE